MWRVCVCVCVCLCICARTDAYRIYLQNLHQVSIKVKFEHRTNFNWNWEEFKQTYKTIIKMLRSTSPSDNSRQQSCFSTLSLPSLGEMEQTVCMLERGTIITKYYPRRRPEQKTLMLRRETRQVNSKQLLLWVMSKQINLILFEQLIWSSVNSSTTSRTAQNYEGSLDLREIKEVICLRVFYMRGNIMWPFLINRSALEKYQKTLKNGATKVNVWILQNVLLFFMAVNSNYVHFPLLVRFGLGIVIDAAVYSLKIVYWFEKKIQTIYSVLRAGMRELDSRVTLYGERYIIIAIPIGNGTMAPKRILSYWKFERNVCFAFNLSIFKQIIITIQFFHFHPDLESRSKS